MTCKWYGDNNIRSCRLGKGPWCSGYGVGPRTIASSFDAHTEHDSILKLRQFHLPQFGSVCSAVYV